MKKYIILTLAGLVLAGCASTPVPAQSSVKLSDSQISVITPTETITNSPTPMAQNITAVIHTSMGDMTVILYPDKAPNTVANFIGLAKGTKEWTNPQGQNVSGTPLYQNVIFHRVIDDFMIQGGDPEGTGRGGPGYTVPAEIGLPHKRGSIATARQSDVVNPRKESSGSQFYIAHKDIPQLDGQYTVFGGIDPADNASLAVLDKIATTPTASDDRPLTDVVIKSIDITEK